MIKAAILFAVSALTTACDYEGCNHPDYGSCANACCRLNIFIEGETTEQVMNKLNASIVKGGPDGRCKFL
jgi:hypothetical protein